MEEVLKVEAEIDGIQALERPTIYLVYGNHGNNPTQLNDYFELFFEVAEASQVELKLEKEVVANAHNILIEMFSEEDVKKIEDIIKRYPDTRIACLCTEFINGDTFNFFKQEENKINYYRSFLSQLPYIIPRPFFKVLKRLLPISVKIFYKSILNEKEDFTSHMVRTFKNRFLNFERLVEHFDCLWCVTDFQLPSYKTKFPNTVVKYFPIVTFRKSPCVRQVDELKDIDVFFSGTITPDRKEKIQQLEAKGLKVVTGMWSEIIREHYLKRSKICLQLKQNPGWPYPSIMRLHQLLTSGNLVLAEKCDVPCIQENFVLSFSNEDFVEKAIQLLKEGNYSERAKEEFANYSLALSPDKKLAINNLSDFLGMIRQEG